MNQIDKDIQSINNAADILNGGKIIYANIGLKERLKKALPNSKFTIENGMLRVDISNNDLRPPA